MNRNPLSHKTHHRGGRFTIFEWHACAESRYPARFLLSISRYLCWHTIPLLEAFQ